MQTSDLQTLMCVVRHGGFAAAARELGVDPSSVSRSVATLETELGTRLFTRNTRRLALTEAGSVFTERLGAVLEELSQARSAAQDATGEIRGRLRVTVSNAFGSRWLSPHLPAFCRQHPAVDLDLLLSEARVDLIAERVDVALRVGDLRDSSLVAVRLLDVRYHVVASPEWVCAQDRVRHTPADMADAPCSSFALMGFRDHWHFTPITGGGAEVVAVRPRMVSTNALMLRDSALAGLGPTLLADWMVADDLARGSLVDLYPQHRVCTPSAPRSAWALYPNRTHVPLKVRAFIDHLRAVTGMKAARNCS